MPKATVNATGWYLENTVGSSSKFYRVIITDNGVCAITWGKIGAQGQGQISSHDTFGEAETIGMRQYFSKLTRGYVEIASQVKFTVDAKVVNGAAIGNDPHMLTPAFLEAFGNVDYSEDRAAVLKEYDAFNEKAQRIMDDASAGKDFEECFERYTKLATEFQALDKAHGEATATLELTKQMLMQNLIGAE